MHAKRVSTALRLQKDLRDELFDLSRMNDRSLNDEIVMRLEQSLRDDHVVRRLRDIEELIHGLARLIYPGMPKGGMWIPVNGFGSIDEAEKH